MAIFSSILPLPGHADPFSSFFIPMVGSTMSEIKFIKRLLDLSIMVFRDPILYRPFFHWRQLP